MITIFELLSCSKEKPPVQRVATKYSALSQTANVNDELMTARSQILNEVLIAAQDSTFRALILNECLGQKYGDYYVRLIDIAERLEGLSHFDDLRNRLIEFDSHVLSITQNRHPILFYPRAETIEAMVNNGVDTFRLEHSIGVYQDVYHENYSSPGYILDESSKLVFYENISEAFAWQHAIWVFGEEEDSELSDGLPESTAHTESITGNRTSGRPEFGGLIQVTNLNAIEHWSLGKPQFEINVFNGSGGQISHRNFGKRARQDFQNQTWCDF